MNIERGTTATLTSTWSEYGGGPLVDLDSVPSVTITRVAGSVVVAGPTTTGVTRVGTGIYAYSWVISASAPVGSYVITWSGLSDGSAVSATELVELVARGDEDHLYATLDDLKAERDAQTDVRDEQLVSRLASASRLIDNLTGRVFWRGDSATAVVVPTARRVAQSDTGDVLIIPDAATADITVELSTIGSGSWITVDPDRYIAETWLTDRPDSVSAYTYLRAPTGTWWGKQTLARITRVAGWPSVPEPIALATLLAANRLFGRRDSPDGIRGAGEWAMRVARRDPDISQLIADYRMPEAG